MQLLDSGYQNSFRRLGDSPGLDSGRVVVELADGRTYTCQTTACTACELGVFFGTEDGVQHFTPWSSVTDVRDAEPDEKSVNRNSAGY